MDRLTAVSRGVLGAWTLMLVEFFWLMVFYSDRLASSWEARTGFLGLLPAWLLLSIPSGVAAGLLGRVTLMLGQGPAPLARALASGAGGLFFGLVAWGVGGGRHLATIEVRSGFAVAVASVAGALFYALLTLAGRLISSQWAGGRGRYVLVAVLGASAAVFEVVNLSVLVRLYPVFHAALSFMALTAAGMTVVLLKSQGGRGGSPVDPAGGGPGREWGVQASPYAVGVVIAVAAFAFVPASKAVSGFDNLRWIIGEAAPTLNGGVQAAAAVAPPPELDPELARLPLGERRPARGVDFRGRDILLISVDALRADHLGAYGYERPTSPAMDALAAEGVRFDAAYAPTPHTSYSITSLMTGKYMRPLLLQGAGGDSDLWATLLQSYGYRTGAFYPPAVFFIDPARFKSFEQANLGFEYSKVEFAEGSLRVGQVRSYLESLPEDRQVFTWVHLFGPHEPYEGDPRYDFGKRDIDLYDSEIRVADDTVREVVALARKRDPNTVVILTADHGEEFGDHGGRYHGTSVFDEQVRVPLIISGPGLAAGRVPQAPVQTIDLLPTVLDALRIPSPPRLRGRSLTQHLEQGTPTNDPSPGRAIAETDDYALLAEGRHRLICQRGSGACQLFDIEADPRQRWDVAGKNSALAERMRATALSIAQSHGTYESEGLRAEGKGWPGAILLGISGSAEVAPTLATLLDDADLAVRRKAAELLFTLGNAEQAPALRLAMTREEDAEARAWLALSLTRMGQGAPLVHELLGGADLKLSRLAALSLAQAGHSDGESVLLDWWSGEKQLEFALAHQILQAFAQIRSKKAVPHLILSLKDVRLRPEIAPTLAKIGDKEALPHLALALTKERYQSARLPLSQAILDLGGDDELIAPLRRFLGVPDLLPDGLRIAQAAGILADVGGPKEEDRKRLQQLSDSGIELSVVVPPVADQGAQVRLIVRCKSTSGQGGTVLVEPGGVRIALKKGAVRTRNQPTINESSALKIVVPGSQHDAPAASPSTDYLELNAVLPESFGARPGHHLTLEIFAPSHIEISAIAAVPLQDDLPPPPPVPWLPETQKNPGEMGAGHR